MAGNTQVVYQSKPNQERVRNTPKAVPQGEKRFYDFTLLFAVVFAFAAGLLIIFSGSQYMAMIETGDPTFYFKKQLMYGGGGLAIGIFCSKFDYAVFRKGHMPVLVYVVTVGLLAATLFLGVASHGKTRWISFGPFSFQPTEPAKIGVILTTAFLISEAHEKINQPKVFWITLAAAALPGMLIMSQNLSSGFIVLAIASVMLFVASRKSVLFLSLLSAGLGVVAFAKPLVRFFVAKTGYNQRPSQYFLRRIMGWALPDMYAADAYQTQQGLYAIGSGGLTGRGLGESIQKFGKIPEVQNDMIFTVICEEFGFFGAVVLVLLYAVILYRIYLIARNARDMFGSMICVGVMAHIGIQVILNIAVVTGVIPNTGVTLPFISYGGSAAAFTMLEIGLVLSVSNRITLNE